MRHWTHVKLAGCASRANLAIPLTALMLGAELKPRPDNAQHWTARATFAPRAHCAAPPLPPSAPHPATHAVRSTGEGGSLPLAAREASREATPWTAKKPVRDRW